MLLKTTHSNIYFAVDSNQQFEMLHETYKNTQISKMKVLFHQIFH